MVRNTLKRLWPAYLFLFTLFSYGSYKSYIEDGEITRILVGYILLILLFTVIFLFEHFSEEKK